jgi:hypothetical protein
MNNLKRVVALDVFNDFTIVLSIKTVTSESLNIESFIYMESHMTGAAFAFFIVSRS